MKKLDLNAIGKLEHEYLQKILLSSVLIQTYQNTLEMEAATFIRQYYIWLVKHYFDPHYTKKELMELFSIKQQIENYFHWFKIEVEGLPLPCPDKHFYNVKYISQIWGYDLKKDANSIFSFFSFFANEILGIPPQIVKNIILLLRSPWRPLLTPLGVTLQKRFQLKEIERYFFGTLNNTLPYKSYVIPDIDRLFSISSTVFENALFFPKSDNFDVFEASLVVHEFQHVINPSGTNLFIQEKEAILAEKIFLQIMGTGKRGRFCWLESNLFYPILLLKWEIEILLTGVNNIHHFHRICSEHSMKNIELSPLFDWVMPFHMSVYAAAAMDLEKSWCTSLRNSNEASAYA